MAALLIPCIILKIIKVPTRNIFKIQCRLMPTRTCKYTYHIKFLRYKIRHKENSYAGRNIFRKEKKFDHSHPSIGIVCLCVILFILPEIIKSQNNSHNRSVAETMNEGFSFCYTVWITS